MKRTWLAAVALPGLMGCGGGGGRHSTAVETDWVVNDSISLGAGYAACVEGPYAIPDGAVIFFDVTDAYQDAMDVSVVSASGVCDGTTGYAGLTSSAWAGTGPSDTNALPAGSYSLAVNCNNLVADCIFTVDKFGYLY